MKLDPQRNELHDPELNPKQKGKGNPKWEAEEEFELSTGWKGDQELKLDSKRNGQQDPKLNPKLSGELGIEMDATGKLNEDFMKEHHINPKDDAEWELGEGAKQEHTDAKSLDMRAMPKADTLVPSGATSGEANTGIPSRATSAEANTGIPSGATSAEPDTIIPSGATFAKPDTSTPRVGTEAAASTSNGKRKQAIANHTRGVSEATSPGAQPAAAPRQLNLQAWVMYMQDTARDAMGTYGRATVAAANYASAFAQYHDYRYGADATLGAGSESERFHRFVHGPLQPVHEFVTLLERDFSMMHEWRPFQDRFDTPFISLEGVLWLRNLEGFFDFPFRMEHRDLYSMSKNLQWLAREMQRTGHGERTFLNMLTVRQMYGIVHVLDHNDQDYRQVANYAAMRMSLARMRRWALHKFASHRIGWAEKKCAEIGGATGEERLLKAAFCCVLHDKLPEAMRIANEYVRWKSAGPGDASKAARYNAAELGADEPALQQHTGPQVADDKYRPANVQQFLAFVLEQEHTGKLQEYSAYIGDNFRKGTSVR